MRRKITEAHLLLIITFAMYMGYQWLMQWIPFHDVMFHVIMGQVMLIFPGALRMLIRYRKNRPQLSERMLFTPISNANIKMAVAVIISAYPVVVILNRFSMFFVKNQVMEVTHNVAISIDYSRIGAVFRGINAAKLRPF